MTTAVVEASGLYAREAAGFVIGLDLALPSGTVGALIGTPQDGARALTHALAGLLRPFGGRLTIGGHAPWSSPRTRLRIGVLLDEPMLPDLGTVRQLLAWSRALRGEREGNEWLSGTGIAELSNVPVRALDRRQARSVALALALAIPSPLLLVLHEPLSGLAREDARWLREQLQARAAQGACVLVLTASTNDAVALADDVATLQRGRIGRAIGAPDAHELAPGATLEVHVWTDHPREVAAAMSLEPSTKGVWMSEDKGAALVLRTEAPAATAAAVARVIGQQHAQLLGLQTMLPGTAQVHEATLRMLRRAGGTG